MSIIQMILWLWISAPATTATTVTHIPPSQHTPQCQPPQCSKIAEATGVVMRTLDGGQNWEDLSMGLPEGQQANIVYVGETTSYLGTGNGLLTSTSGACRSEWKSAALSGNVIGVFPGEAGPYAVCYQNGFYQYLDKAQTWESMSDKLSDKFVHFVHELPGKTLMAGCESGLYRSKNNGKSWERVLEKGACTRFVMAGNAIIASGHRSLWRSDDMGDTWTQILTNLAEPIQVRNVGEALVAIDAGQDLPGMDFNNTVYWSGNDGISWSAHPVPMSEGLADVYDICSAGNHLYACSANMIWSSSDNGKTWDPVLEMPKKIGGFFKMETRGDALYVLRLVGC